MGRGGRAGAALVALGVVVGRPGRDAEGRRGNAAPPVAAGLLLRRLQPGGPRGCKPGATEIGVTNARYLGGTDNYLAFEDWGERIVVLKLACHAEETVEIRTK